MRFAFVTCVQIGLSCIEEIYNLGFDLKLIITLKEDKGVKKSGRIFIDDFCKNNNIELLKVESINENICSEKVRSLNIDWLFIIGWSQIAKSVIIDSPNNGVIGAHPTLLPKGRGRASIPWAILKSLEYTGVTFFKIDEGVDTGKIIAQEIIRIDEKENATSLYNKVVAAHVNLIGKLLPNLIKSNIKYQFQDESKASYWPSRRPEDGEINLKGSVLEAEKLIRATTKPYPGAYFFRNHKKIIIWKAKLIEKRDLNIDKGDILEFSDGYLLVEEMSKI